MPFGHSIRSYVPLLAITATAAGNAAIPQAQTTLPPATFTIFVASRPVGTEQVQLHLSNEGWTISSSGRIGLPLDLITRQLEVRYDADWRPIGLKADTTLRGRSVTVRSTVEGTTATNETTQLGAPSVEHTEPIDQHGIFVLNPIVAPFEAVTARLRTAEPGATLMLYRPALGSVAAVVGQSSVERIQTLKRIVNAKKTHLNLQSPGAAPLDIEVWSDEEGRLLRLRLPIEGLDAIREDIASVSARRVGVTRPDDEQLRIPANGFSLAGTLSKPMGASGPQPTIVLVAGPAIVDRDELTGGVPVFGLLANALADRGFQVLRYDKRGTGQSGGRPESASLRDYAEDVRAVVRTMADRKDVDRKRLVLLGYGDGGWFAMLAADKRVSGLALVGTGGVAGTELNMYQVVHGLEQSNRPDEERQKIAALQKNIQEAVITGKGWDTGEISAAIRRQADTPYFQSFLQFDPGKALRDVSQPVLIVQGELDKEVPPSNAEQLEARAKERKRQAPIEVVKIHGVNHLLVSATTGKADEYKSLGSPELSPAVVDAIASWMMKTTTAKP